MACNCRGQVSPETYQLDTYLPDMELGMYLPPAENVIVIEEGPSPIVLVGGAILIAALVYAASRKSQSY